ncbi:MAG TPA: deoxynucleoside kinase [Patescibacteria group bacterium]
MEDKRVVTIIGNIGVGKTTSLPLIAKALNADIIRADELFQVNPFRDNFLQNPTRWALTNEIYLLHKRIKFIKDEIKNCKKQTIVIDSGILMSWVYAKSHYLSGKITLDEWLFFEEIFSEWSQFALNTSLFYLHAPKETLLGRIKKRSRDFEIKLYKERYLEELESGLRDFCANFSKKMKNIIHIDTNSLNLSTSQKDKNTFIKSVKANFSISEK